MTAGKSAEISAEKQAEYVRRMWDRQFTMWKVTDIKRLAGCHRWRNGNSQGVPLVWSAAGHVKWGGLQNSHSVWSSPVAAAAISLERIATAKRAAAHWLADHPNGSVILMVATLAHDRYQGLSTLMNALAKCHTATFKNGWTTDKKRYGIAAWHKQVECTVGEVNGWHPHHNVLLFAETALSDEQLNALEGRLFERHAAAAVNEGLKSPNRKRGVRLYQATDLENAEVMAAYAAKGAAESLAGEAAGGTFKEASNGHMTQWQLLDAIHAARGDRTAAAREFALWREWEKATQGRRQSSWSRGAKDLLRLDVLDDDEVETTDLLEALDTDEDMTRYVVAIVNQKGWDRKLSDDVGRRLDAAEYVRQAKTPEVAKYRAHAILETLHIPHESVLLPIESLDDVMPPDDEGKQPVSLPESSPAAPLPAWSGDFASPLPIAAVVALSAEEPAPAVSGSGRVAQEFQQIVDDRCEQGRSGNKVLGDVLDSHTE